MTSILTRTCARCHASAADPTIALVEERQDTPAGGRAGRYSSQRSTWLTVCSNKAHCQARQEEQAAVQAAERAAYLASKYAPCVACGGAIYGQTPDGQSLCRAHFEAARAQLAKVGV